MAQQRRIINPQRVHYLQRKLNRALRGVHAVVVWKFLVYVFILVFGFFIWRQWSRRQAVRRSIDRDGPYPGFFRHSR